ncbi:prenyltransferase [Sanguibacter sp. HDW7]|uniref:prenyltransferase n=1 Tax=Sanguibacter sp. HDW7 TaxID=2714931 RepID=UPI00140C68D1|nr:prenyltransferase [Sanguibacter sp. HDW7]QIK84232.1 prenyltransferase [Sanguibacter sp. HDW7]
MTYATLAAVVLALAAAAHVGLRAVARRRGTLPAGLGAATTVTALVLVVLTVVFDSAMIAADLFRFEESQLLGLRVGLAPVEDLAWPVASALVLPVLAAAVAPGGGEARDDARRRTLARLVGTSRPVSWINTAYPFVAAYLLAGGTSWWLGTVAALFLLVPYNLAMYGINDVFDHDSDVANPRKGGIEGIVLERGLHRTTLVAAVVTNVPFLVVLLVAGTALANAVLLVAVVAVVGYSAPPLRLKERPVLDSLTSSTHFVAPAVYGVALAGGAWTGEVVAVLVAFFCWGVASHAFGAVQDVRADREAGIGSVATVLGARLTTRLALAAYALAAVVLLVGAGWPGHVAALVPLLHLLNVWPHRHVTDATCETANAGWRRFLWLNQVCGFVVTLVVLAILLDR